MWDQNSLSYGVRSQAFFDVVALRLDPTRDNSFSGLKSVTIITSPVTQNSLPQQTAKHDGQSVTYSPSR